MKIVLLERVEKLGDLGQVVTVKGGYARNYLLPQAKALRATEENIKRFEREREALEARNKERREQAENYAKAFEGSVFVLIRQAGDTGQLYGSVSARDIAEIARKKMESLVPSQIVLDKPIKAIGLYPVSLRLHPEVSVDITINVARSEEEAERQKQGEDIIATQKAEDQAISEERNQEIRESQEEAGFDADLSESA